jgi:hypothetical protein
MRTTRDVILVGITAACLFSGVVVTRGGAENERNAAGDTPIQARMKACLVAGGSRAVAPKVMYNDCMAGFDYMKAMKPRDTNHQDTMVTAAVLEIYAGAAALELGRRSEAKARIEDGKAILLEVAAHSDDPDVRNRARTMKSCLIDRDPACIERWKKAVAGASP